MSLGVLALFGIALLAGPVTYQIAPAERTRVAVELYRTGLKNGKTHRFEFPRYQGSLSFDADSPDRSKVDLTVEADSIECKDDGNSLKDRRKLLAEVRGVKVLDVEHFPELRFVGKRINPKGRDDFEIEGLLSIREVARPATLLVRLRTEGARLRLTGSAEIKFSDYELKPPAGLLGSAGAKDEMKLEFEVVAER